MLQRLIRPLVEADGGTLEIVRADDTSVALRLGGMCSGCPGAPFTRQRIIERTLRAIVLSDIRIEFESTAPGALRGTASGNVAAAPPVSPLKNDTSPPAKTGEGGA